MGINSRRFQLPILRLDQCLIRMRCSEKVLDRVNSYFLEQLILDPIRKDAILDLASSGAQDPVQEALAGKLSGSKCNTIRFNIAAEKSRACKSHMWVFGLMKGTR